MQKAFGSDLDSTVALNGKPTEENLAWDTLPLLSPDGKSLAYLAMQRPGLEAERIGSKYSNFPDENHRVLKPHNSVQWHDNVNQWLYKHLDESDGVKPAKMRSGQI